MSFGEVEDKNMHARKPLFTASGFKHPTSPTEIDYAPERPIPQKMVQRTFDRWNWALRFVRLARMKLTRNAPRIMLRSEEHTSELQSLMRLSYAVFGWKIRRANV